MSIYDFVHKHFENFVGGNVRSHDEGANSGFPRQTDPFAEAHRADDENDDISISVKVSTDPFEIQIKLFEGSFIDFFNSISAFIDEHDSFEIPGAFQSPAIQDPTAESSNPREHWLKPGVGNTQSNKDNFNNELENRPNILSWLDSFLPPAGQQDKDNKPRVFSSFSSVTRKTVRLPDGTVKTEEIIRKPDGTEERTESETLPDERSPPILESPPFLSPNFGFSGFFNLPKQPYMETEPDVVTPSAKDQFLKPGYEKSNPQAAKVDKDLDSQVLQSGSINLPSFSEKHVTKPPDNQFSFKSVIRKTVILPSGVKETEEIVQNSDGTQQRTVTQTLPDGSTKTTLTPHSDSLNEGSISLFENNILGERSSTLKGVKDFIDLLFK